MPLRLVAFLVIGGLLASCAKRPRVVAPPPMFTSSMHGLVPLPVSVEPAEGAPFTITSETAIVAGGGDAALRIAWYLRDWIGIAAGPEPLRVDVAGAEVPPGTILLRLDPKAAGGDEGYELTVLPDRVTIVASAAAGLFYGVQTLRQLLPPFVEYEAVRFDKARPVTVPAGRIVDRPRFEWRGSMLDVARHFFSVDEVKRHIDLMTVYKLNRLHLHLADDQGWRIEITSWPNLTAHGGSTEVGGGPGGFYTQEQYAEIVRYAADRFITIVPEIDMPGHTNAALASYAELNCDGVARPLYTGIEVGFSALCVEKEVTYRFVDDVVREIAAMTPGPWFHAGGDEVKTLTPAQYNGFVERVQDIVKAHGKRMIGWDEVEHASLAADSVVQLWRSKTALGPAVSGGAKVILSISSRAYLDMKYDATTAIGLTWAGLIDVRDAYDWDPATLVPGVAGQTVLGVESPLWSETLATIRDVEFLAFPRLLAIAEVAWSPQERRGWDDFRQRLAGHGPRLTALGVNFHRAPSIPWR